MKRLILAIAILPWMIIACNNASEKKSVNEIALAKTASKDVEQPDNIKTNASKAKLQDNEEVLVAAPVGADIQENGNTSLPAVIDWDKKIIKTGNLKLEVKDYSIYSKNIQSTVRKYGGYVAREENFSTDEKIEAVLSIKVPVQFFEPLINELPGADTKQLERSILSEEVTSQIIDTKARLETKKATRDKYLQFLKQSNKIEDVLKVQAEINTIQEDIESADTRLTHLNRESRYSTINLTFFEPQAGYTGDGSSGYVPRLVAAFKNGGQWFANLFVALMYIWPLYIFIFAGYFAFKVLRRLRHSRRTQ